MSLDNPTFSNEAEPSRLEAEVARLAGALRRAEDAYAELKPRYDELRRECPSVRVRETRTLQGIGNLRDDLQIARAQLLYYRGEGPRPKTWIGLVDGKMPMSFIAALAEQSRAEVGRQDQSEP